MGGRDGAALATVLFGSEHCRARARTGGIRRGVVAGPGTVRSSTKHVAAGRMGDAAGTGPVLSAQCLRLAWRPLVGDNAVDQRARQVRCGIGGGRVAESSRSV